MKATVETFVQGTNLVPSSVVGQGRVSAVTLSPESADKAGFLAPQTSITLTALDKSMFPSGAKVKITVEVTPDD